MTRRLTIHLLIAISTITHGFSDRPASLTPEQQTLVDQSMGRFREQGLVAPKVRVVFHDSLFPCYGHKGLYRDKTRTLEMCSLDEATLLHELAHAWANDTLDSDEMEAFVNWRGLDSWNDHSHAWERRGTEHVAETIAWALLEEPNHVRWVEIGEDGTRSVSYRILTLGIDTDTLRENFERITGMSPVFRADGPEETPFTASPELARLGH